jgi:zinc transport system substrate-binding protein
MKQNHIYKTIAIGIAALALAGCSSEEKGEVTKTGGKGAGKPVAYVSNYPLKYIVERLASPFVEVRFAAGASDDPAYWNPKPEDISGMQQADLIVLNGASYEQWLKKVSLPQSKLVDTSAGFRDRLIALEESVTHSHGLEGKHEHSGTAFTTWLDMTLAVEQARSTKDAVAARWPEHKLQFEDRFVKLENDLRALDEDIAAVISRAPERTAIFSHPVYQYFKRRYAVNGKSVHWEPDEMPDEAKWSEFQELLKQHPAKWMIWEGKPLQSVVDKLQALGVNSLVVDPCGNAPEDGNFLSVMRQNVEALRRLYQ